LLIGLVAEIATVYAKCSPAEPGGAVEAS